METNSYIFMFSAHSTSVAQVSDKKSDSNMTSIQYVIYHHIIIIYGINAAIFQTHNFGEGGGSKNYTPTKSGSFL
jgi:hypothetical protein